MAYEAVLLAPDTHLRENVFLPSGLLSLLNSTTDAVAANTLIMLIQKSEIVPGFYTNTFVVSCYSRVLLRHEYSHFIILYFNSIHIQFTINRTLYIVNVPVCALHIFFTKHMVHLNSEKRFLESKIEAIGQ